MVDWAFVWCEWCRLVVVAVCELQKSARARAEGLEGVGVLIHNLPASGLVPSALKVAPTLSFDCRFL